MDPDGETFNPRSSLTMDALAALDRDQMHADGSGFSLSIPGPLVHADSGHHKLLSKPPVAAKRKFLGPRKSLALPGGLRAAEAGKWSFGRRLKAGPEAPNVAAPARWWKAPKGARDPSEGWEQETTDSHSSGKRSKRMARQSTTWTAAEQREMMRATEKVVVMNRPAQVCVHVLVLARHWAHRMIPGTGLSLRSKMLFLLRTALKDSPQGPPRANRQSPTTANHQPPPTATNRHQPLK